MYFLSISPKIYSTTSSQDMHEMLSSYEYGLQEKYIAPYFTENVKSSDPMMIICQYLWKDGKIK